MKPSTIAVAYRDVVCVLRGWVCRSWYLTDAQMNRSIARQYLSVPAIAETTSGVAIVAYEGSHQKYEAVCEKNVLIAARDGVRLAGDIYFPAESGERAAGQFPVILERTPYDKSAPQQVTKAKFFARRGYVCVIQDVRGRLKSEGEWHPFAKEAPDGYDTVEWLGAQEWSTGKVGTMGDSYAGSDQAALATLNPPHLATMIVAVGAANYFHSSMRQNGCLEQRFLIYSFRMATNSREALADPALKAQIDAVFPAGIGQIVNSFPLKKGVTLLRSFPTIEQWAMELQTEVLYGDYWKQRGYAPEEYYDEHADVPTLYLGGWYDSYARNTPRSYELLSKIKKSPQRLMMGPWTHGQYEVTASGDLDYGTDSHIDYLDLKLSWFDHYLKGMNTEAAELQPVMFFTMGTGHGRRGPEVKTLRSQSETKTHHGGYWRGEQDWPLPGTKYTDFYLIESGQLRPDEAPGRLPGPTQYTFDPRNPVPTIGGGISAADPIMKPGAFDQRGRADFFGCTDTLPLNARPDVLTFQTPPLQDDIEVTGPIEMHLFASSSAVDTDFTAKLIDVYPPDGSSADERAFNITDSIVRARFRNGWEKEELMTPGEIYELVFELYPTSNVFRKGHRVRLDISSSNWPRFDVNPNTGGPLGAGGPVETAIQSVYHDAAHPSRIVLPVQPR